MKFILLYAFLILPIISLAESKLENIKEKTKEKEKPTKTTHKHNHHNDHDYDSDDDYFLIEITWYIFLSIYALPHNFIDPGYDIMASFSKYPYHPSQGARGYLDMNETKLINAITLHTSAEAKFYTDDIRGYGTHINFYNTWRFDVLTDYTYLTENIDENETSNLSLGSANITFRFAQNETIQMRSGIGINFLSDDNDKASGFNFLYAIDMYPAKPMFFSLRFDGGRIGSAEYTRLRGLIGLTYKRLEINTGFEIISLGGESLNGVILGAKITF